MSKKTEEKYLYWFVAKDASGKDRKFCILKPTRKMKEDGELFYASRLSQFISAGILPKIVWDKMFKDCGGIISSADQKEYSDLFVEFSEFKNSVDALSSTLAKDRTADEQGRIQFLEAQVVRVRKRMQEMEMAQVNAFENTAEAKARNRTIVWWAANLAIEEDAVAGANSILGDGSIDEKLDNYDSIVEDDQFLSDSFSRLNYLVTIWYLGSAADFEDFKSLDLEYLKRVEDETVSEPISQDDSSLIKDTEEKAVDKEPESVSVISEEGLVNPQIVEN